MMATRSGDLYPAIVRFLCEREQISPAKAESILNHQSGLLGVSGVSHPECTGSSLSRKRRRGAGNRDVLL